MHIKTPICAIIVAKGVFIMHSRIEAGPFIAIFISFLIIIIGLIIFLLHLFVF